MIFMSIYQKSDFYNAALTEIQSGDYPELKTRLAVGDVLITQQIGAIAQMCAMLSYQIGLAQSDVWLKARDNMVLADASARGVLPFAKASKYQLKAISSNKTVSITQGRQFLDNAGRTWTATNAKNVGKTETIIEIEQYETREIAHTVSETKSFYKIEIPQPENHLYIHSVAVKDENGVYFQQVNHFYNIALDEKVFHIQSDEMQKISVVFGVQDILGYTPHQGETMTLIVKYTNGDVVLSENTPFELAYLSGNDKDLSFLSGSQIQQGALPYSLSELREITNYPSAYNTNAVFLGEFKFLLQKQLYPFNFLNVWNELEEEQARGANLDNINTLFVSFDKTGIATKTAQENIKEIIYSADNSYKIKFVEPVKIKINVQIKLTLAPMHDESAVKSQIINFLLDKYGATSEWAKNGAGRINSQNTIKMLREKIPALQDGVSDIVLTVSESISKRLPEHWRYVTENSISITSEKL